VSYPDLQRCGRRKDIDHDGKLEVVVTEITKNDEVKVK
jgi:hypothetical protein